MLDTDDTAATEHGLVNVLAALAAAAAARRNPSWRCATGVAHIPRLTRTRALTPPPTPAWRLATHRQG